MNININNINCINYRRKTDNKKRNSNSNVYFSSNTLERAPRKDTVTFCANKKNSNNFLQKYPKEFFPERIYTILKNASENGDGEKVIDIYKIHKDVYSELEKCTTLDEAKAKYPEFQNVKELREIENKSKIRVSTLKDMAEGKLQEPDGSFALHALKYLYCFKETEIKRETLVKYAKRLGINPLNSDYERLIKSNSPEKLEQSVKQGKKVWDNDEYRKRMESMFESPIYRRQMSEMASDRWQNEEFRKRMQSIQSSQEYQEKISKTVKSLWEDEEYRKQMSEKLKDRWQNPEYRGLMESIFNSKEHIEKCREIAKEIWSDTERKENARDRAVKMWQEPDYREKTLSVIQSDENREKCSEKAKERWQNPTYRKKMMEYYTSKEFRRQQSENAKKQWNENEEFRQNINKAILYAWSQLGDVIEYARQLRQKRPYIRNILAKMDKKPLSKHENSLLLNYYKDVWAYNNANTRFGALVSQEYKRLKQEGM